MKLHFPDPRKVKSRQQNHHLPKRWRKVEDAENHFPLYLEIQSTKIERRSHPILFFVVSTAAFVGVFWLFIFGANHTQRVDLEGARKIEEVVAR